MEGAVLFGEGGILALGPKRTDLAHAGDQAFVGFHRGIRQGAGPADIGARGGGRVAVLDRLVLLVERDHEGIARARDRLEKSELLLEPAVVGVFLDLRERLAVAAPAVGEGRRTGDIVHVLAQEGRAVVGDGLDCGAVDDGMGGPAPCEYGGGQGGGGKRCEIENTHIRLRRSSGI